jgi:4-hydroxy-tetrahydrodipicolinate synthase
MATPPLLAEHSEAELAAYYHAIIDATPLPVVVQDASAYVGKPLSIAFQAKLHEAFGAKVLFKPEALPLAPHLASLKAVVPSAQIFEGMGGGALVDTYPLGIAGTMPGAEVCWAVVALWDALERGDEALSLEIHRPLTRMLAVQTTLDAFLTCEKFLLRDQGVIRTRTVRTPSSFRLTTQQQSELRSLLEELRTVTGS